MDCPIFWTGYTVIPSRSRGTSQKDSAGYLPGSSSRSMAPTKRYGAYSPLLTNVFTPSSTMRPSTVRAEVRMPMVSEPPSGSDMASANASLPSS